MNARQKLKKLKKDRLFEAEIKKKLKPCPICGSKAYIHKDIVDGHYYGWSVGCPLFWLNDGRHGVDGNASIEEHLEIHYLNSTNECIEKWNKKVDKYSDDYNTESEDEK